MYLLMEAASHPLNVVYTVLLGVMLLYWLSVVLGAVSMDALEVEVDLDADADLNADGEIGAGGWLASALHFFHFGKVPTMFIMTIVILTAWSLNVLNNHYWGNYQVGYALAMTAPILLVSFLVAKLVSYPFIPIFTSLNQPAKPVEYVGLHCRVKLPPSGKQFGQGGVFHDGDELLVNIKSEYALKAGDETVIIGQTEDGRYWLVEPR